MLYSIVLLGVAYICFPRTISTNYVDPNTVNGIVRLESIPAEYMPTHAVQQMSTMQLLEEKSDLSDDVIYSDYKPPTLSTQSVEMCESTLPHHVHPVAYDKLHDVENQEQAEQ